MLRHWLYKILASFCLKVQEASWFLVVFFSLLGKELSRRQMRAGPMLSKTVSSSRFVLPHLWLQALLRTEGIIANVDFAVEVKFCQQQQQICCFMEWLPAPLYPVTLLGCDIWRPQASGPRHLIFTFGDSGFLYILLDFRLHTLK